MKLLVVGGTRNVGHHLVEEALARGHRVTVLNRGRTPDELPRDVERLRADRTAPGELSRAIGGRSWDAVIDTTSYDARDAAGAVASFDGRTGCYVHLSTGQVYLVRDGARSLAREVDYDGPILPEPPRGTADWSEWSYGVEKRAAEAVLAEAWEARRFPSVRLRLPMIHGERDHYGRLHGYLARLDDGGPIVVPAEGSPPIRHVDRADVVRFALDAAERRAGVGGAWNVAQPDTWALDELLTLLAREAGLPLRVARVPRAALEARALLPAASPFSGRWMSALDASLAERELGWRSAPMPEYLPRIVADWLRRGRPRPAGYVRRRDEIDLAVIC